MSDFSNDFMNDFNIVLPGARTSAKTPLFRAVTSYNKLEINKAAADIMNVTGGDYVVLIDRKSETTDVNNIYFIFKSPVEKGAKVSEIGGRLPFSYSGIWGGMQIGNPELHTAGKEDVKRAGLTVAENDKIAIQSVSYEVKPTEHTIVFEGASCPIFALVDRNVNEVNSRFADDEGENAPVDISGIEDNIDNEE